ncbi:MAG: ATP-binding protein [Planctomycetota bacterium]|nr:ATP-binding protein [Planctomycetota bacterium]
MKIAWVNRSMEAEFARVRDEYPVVTITGPRQSGKTSLAKHYCGEYAYANLELPEVRKIAQSDPKAFFSAYPAPVIIDEVQRVPELLSYIQGFADATDQGGQYILTGSYQLGLAEAVSQSLAGRTALLRLLPLSLAELKNAGVEDSRDDILFKGFMPRLYHDDIRPGTLYSEYFQNYIERDLRKLAAIRDLLLFEKFLRVLAGRVGQVINISSLSGDVGVSRATLNEWLTVLEASFIIFRLPPWFENANKRAIKTPKLYFTEPGLAAWLLEIETPRQISRDPLLGNLFENMVIAEVLKARLNADKMPNLFFYRDTKGNEVDLVLRQHRRLKPVEIKAAMTFSPEMTRGLKHFCGKFSDVLPGAVVYAGDIETKSETSQLLNFRNASELAF